MNEYHVDLTTSDQNYQVTDDTELVKSVVPASGDDQDKQEIDDDDTEQDKSSVTTSGVDRDYQEIDDDIRYWKLIDQYLLSYTEIILSTFLNS